MSKNKTFNIILLGVGGQGLITLLEVLAETALEQKFDVKTSELHGLAQRGGSVQAHLRFGKKIFSPLVPQKSADLIIALEAQEALNGLPYAQTKTIFLLNDSIRPAAGRENKSAKQILMTLKKRYPRALLIPASKITREHLKNEVLSGTYLIGLAVFKKLMPLRKNSVTGAIKKVLPQKYLLANLSAFALAEKNVKK